MSISHMQVLEALQKQVTEARAKADSLEQALKTIQGVYKQLGALEQGAIVQDPTVQTQPFNADIGAFIPGAGATVLPTTAPTAMQNYPGPPRGIPQNLAVPTTGHTTPYLQAKANRIARRGK